MAFIKKEEKFVCGRCGKSVQGDGYTNHCPECLWSRHVDNDPGDRKNTCRGMMEPVGADQKSGEMVLIHRCTLCGAEKKNRTASGDNSGNIIQISALPFRHQRKIP
jgi:hypothetical protein